MRRFLSGSRSEKRISSWGRVDSFVEIALLCVDYRGGVDLLIQDASTGIIYGGGVDSFGKTAPLGKYISGPCRFDVLFLEVRSPE